jgi:alkylation response protein AidB-like acyl-CoA dehydrogenase
MIRGHQKTKNRCSKETTGKVHVFFLVEQYTTQNKLLNALASTMSVLINSRDLQFILFELLNVETLCQSDRYAHCDKAMFEATLDTAHQIALDRFDPLAKICDEAEPRIEEGRTILPDGVANAVKAYVDAGLLNASADLSEGGLQLPVCISQACMALFVAANPALAVYPFVTNGVATVISNHGSEAQKKLFAGPLRAGCWFGVMAISETQAGSSVADLKTEAIPTEAGHYLITGSKMWITGAAQDFTENIVHLVLARIAGAPAGTRGISLFIVPKYRLSDSGRPDVWNDVNVVGLNHKMGFRGISNTVLSLGDQNNCHGYLVGEPNKGLRYMFDLINEARIWVGTGSAALGYSGYLRSLNYAKERTQGRTAADRDPNAPQVSIIEHADVRRLLLTQKAYVEGGLCLALYCARLVDQRKIAASKGERDKEADLTLLLEILTPIIKSWPSEFCLEANKHAIQVLGGYGYTRDFPLERLYRDNRLNAIHEGTYGIQAIDLLGRKVSMAEGRGFQLLLSLMSETAELAKKESTLAWHGNQLDQYLTRLTEVTQKISALLGTPESELALANAVHYLDAFGHIVVGWLWLRQAMVAETALRDGAQGDAAFYKGKLFACEFFYRREMQKVTHFLDLVEQREATCFNMKQDFF